MSWFTLLPAALTLALALALGRVALPLHPVWSAWLLAVTAVTTVLSAVGTVVFVAVNYGATLWPQAAARLPEWALIGDDSPVPGLLGLPAMVLTGASALVTGRLAARWVADVRDAQQASRRLVETEVPIAVAVPGRRGGVLVSRGLLRRFTPAELEVVFRHEGSHLRHRHHRFLAAGALAAALLPPLRPLDRRLRFCLERWADEDAAEAVGDRRLVARTIARVALARTGSVPPPLPGFADSGVVERVQALLATPPGKNPVTGPVIVTGGGLTTGTLAATALRLDHALMHTFL